MPIPMTPYGNYDTDLQIDALVYELGVYPAVGGRLTEKEIRLIEETPDR